MKYSCANYKINIFQSIKKCNTFVQRAVVYRIAFVHRSHKGCKKIDKDNSSKWLEWLFSTRISRVKKTNDVYSPRDLHHKKFIHLLLYTVCNYAHNAEQKGRFQFGREPTNHHQYACNFWIEDISNISFFLSCF